MGKKGEIKDLGIKQGEIMIWEKLGRKINMFILRMLSKLWRLQGGNRDY